MAPGVQIVLSGTLTFGVPLLCAVRELIVLRRRPGGGGGDFRRHPEPPPRPRTQPDLPKLPDCLIPSLPPRPVAGEGRSRSLELA